MQCGASDSMNLYRFDPLQYGRNSPGRICSNNVLSP
jgi:hypothetical protein